MFGYRCLLEKVRYLVPDIQEFVRKLAMVFMSAFNKKKKKWTKRAVPTIFWHVCQHVWEMLLFLNWKVKGESRGKEWGVMCCCFSTRTKYVCLPFYQCFRYFDITCVLQMLLSRTPSVCTESYCFVQYCSKTPQILSWLSCIETHKNK